MRKIRRGVFHHSQPFYPIDLELSHLKNFMRHRQFKQDCMPISHGYRDLMLAQISEDRPLCQMLTPRLELEVVIIDQCRLKIQITYSNTLEECTKDNWPSRYSRANKSWWIAQLIYKFLPWHMSWSFQGPTLSTLLDSRLHTVCWEYPIVSKDFPRIGKNSIKSISDAGFVHDGFNNTVFRAEGPSQLMGRLWWWKWSRPMNRYEDACWSHGRGRAARWKC